MIILAALVLAATPSHATPIPAAGSVAASEMFRRYDMWLDLQYYVGRCRRHLSKAEVGRLRGWGALRAGTVGDRIVLRQGDEMYESGVRDDLELPASSLDCWRMLTRWSREMGRR